MRKDPRAFVELDTACELTSVNERQRTNNVSLQSVNGKILGSINWIFGVNRRGLVWPAKTLKDPRVWRIGTDDVKNKNRE